MSKITPVLFHSFNQRHLIARLVEHCRALDGTKIKLVEGPEPKVGYPAVCNVAFRTVCEAMKGKTFVWLEADSIPTQPGWLKALEAEWEVAKSFGKSGTAYRRILECYPEETDAASGAAWSAFYEGRKAEAKRFFRMVVSVNPDYPEALKGLELCD